MHTHNNLLSLFFKEAAGPSRTSLIKALDALKATNTNLAAENRRLIRSRAGAKGGWTAKLNRTMRDAEKAKKDAARAATIAKKDAVKAATKDAGTKAGKAIAKQRAHHDKEVAKLESQKSRAKKIYGGGGLALGAGGGGAAGYAIGSIDENLDFSDLEDSVSNMSEVLDRPDPVTYGAGGALLGGGVSHVWGKLADRPDLARDLIVAIGTGLAGATYAASQGNNG